jgi:prepilin-type N-terminal cleavage/methylation domain-containing protein
MKINFYKRIQNDLKQKRGFTVLETLIAISVILIAITGPLVVISQSLKASLHAREEITAYYLAQEAVEYARLLRDANILPDLASSDGWLSGVDGLNHDCESNANDPTPQKCYLEYVGLDVVTAHFQTCPNSGIGCPYVRVDTSASSPYYGLYSLPESASTEKTNFKREIYFTKVRRTGDSCDIQGCDDREIHMKIVVTWDGIGGSQSEYVLNERLFNWKAVD